jgi:hypothetical protein
MGEKRREPMLSDTFLSRLGQRSLAFIRDDSGGNDHEEVLQRVRRLQNRAPTNSDTVETAMG